MPKTPKKKTQECKHQFWKDRNPPGCFNCGKTDKELATDLFLGEQVKEEKIEGYCRCHVVCCGKTYKNKHRNKCEPTLCKPADIATPENCPNDPDCTGNPPHYFDKESNSWKIKKEDGTYATMVAPVEETPEDWEAEFEREFCDEKYGTMGMEFCVHADEVKKFIRSTLASERRKVISKAIEIVESTWGTREIIAALKNLKDEL